MVFWLHVLTFFHGVMMHFTLGFFIGILHFAAIMHFMMAAGIFGCTSRRFSKCNGAKQADAECGDEGC